MTGTTTGGPTGPTAQEGSLEVALQDVSDALWRERELLERLLFKLEEERAILEAGDQRWISWCVDEIRNVVQRLEQAERARRQAWASVADQLGVSPDAPLRELIDAVAFPWDAILIDHQRALSGAAREIEATTEADDRLADAGAADLARRLSWLRPALAA